MDKLSNIKVEITDSQECLNVEAKAIDRVIMKAILECRSADSHEQRSLKDSRPRGHEDSINCSDISEAFISVAIVDNNTIRRLKKEFLDIDEVTDVLAFPLSDPGQIADGHLEGEIVISAEKALEEATRRKIEPQAELGLYAVHGMLHLLGYDDRNSAEAAIMYQKEREILSRVGYDSVR